MPRGCPIEPLVLTDDAKSQLESIAHSRSLPHGVVQRAHIVLASADGEANASIAKRLRLTMPLSASGATDIVSTASKACTMNCAPADREPARTSGSPR